MPKVYRRHASPKYLEDPATGCWNWQGATDHAGYGADWWKGRYYRAHRSVYEQHKGPIPIGLVLDHLCRNPRCVNPDHLEPVTDETNVRRSRQVILNPEKVRQIMLLAKAGKTSKEIAKMFGVAKQTVDRQRCKRPESRNWKEIIV